MEFGDLLGKTLARCERFDGTDDGDVMYFETINGAAYELYHGQDCCERM
jgi:hypothetical protein